MTKLVYCVIEHDGGWAYTVGGSISETFKTHDQARSAAERAAHAQMRGGDDVEISFEEPDGRWREEFAQGDDRPETEVRG
jgi:hypothetical protein